MENKQQTFCRSRKSQIWFREQVVEYLDACILTKPPALALKGSFKVISSSGASFLPKARPTTLTPCGRSRNFWRTLIFSNETLNRIHQKSYKMNFTRILLRQITFRSASRLLSTEVAPAATAGSASKDTNAPTADAAESIVNSIAALSLLEVSELSSLLKKRLNLPETAFVAPQFAAGPAGGPAGASAEEEEVEAPKKVQTAFKVKLVKFDEKQKVALIKEIKNLLEGMNLVQAKKFVESAPTIVKEDLPKEEAEKLKEALTKAGAIIEIE
uniref:Uncharacterized protein n=1 Tax=Glossina palpalis gambiensis TaxID=67801 RepID=A0A1B0BQZ3_9MUSC